MSDKDAGVPRVFLVRHGETEWTQSGQYTGKTDIPLTAHGEAQVTATGRIVFGAGKLIDPARLAKIWSSPRSRAARTCELLAGSGVEYETTESLAEWDYGEYEGLKTAEIRKKRADKGLDQDRAWDIWQDGAEGGETPQQVTDRIDALIKTIRTIQAPFLKGSSHSATANRTDDAQRPDVVIVAHGHLTRAFAKRWLGYDLSVPLSLMMEPGGVGVLSYQHHSIDEPALLLGIGFPLTQS